ncbi:hypothetical protein HDU98_003330 [Podochytrium sp. JEL0797]|nr:hypothetical protein HDU98_003330 [Podochytrium sp. JEL0797]
MDHIFELLGVPVLKDHWKVALASAITWHCVFTSGRIRCSSFLNAILVCILAVPNLMDPRLYNDKLWGYTKEAGDMNAIVLGYFLWDVYVSLIMGDVGFIVHGVACFIVFFLCFRPFLMYFGAVFIMYEASTPFLNIHWACDKLGYTGGMLQLVNGLCLLASFFSARILFGLYSSVSFYYEMYTQFDKIPIHLVISYSVLNFVLNGLNLFWFFKLVDGVRRRFQPGGKNKVFGESGSSGMTVEEVDGMGVKQE